MHKYALAAIAREQLEAAHRAESGRAAQTLVGGHERVMRQTVVALTAGTVLAEHENPGEATLQTVLGRVEVHAGDDQWDIRAGDLIEIPQQRHSVHAIEDSAILLTAALH